MGTISDKGTASGGCLFSPELSNQWSSSPFCLALKLYALGCPRHIRILPGGPNTGDQDLSRSVFLELRARRAATAASPIPAARLRTRLAGKAERTGATVSTFSGRGG